MKKSNRPEEQPLKVRIENGQLMITAGVNHYAYCVKRGLQDQGLWPSDFGKILDNEGFCRDILNEIDKEDETGDTPLLRFFDKCALEALENGSIHVNYINRKRKKCFSRDASPCPDGILT